MVKAVQEGTYKVTANKEGYKEKIITISVNDGEMTRLDLKLNKN